MASAVIHLCIAKEVNKYLNMNLNELLLGSIAPDISKQVGETKEISNLLDKKKFVHEKNKFIRLNKIS